MGHLVVDGQSAHCSHAVCDRLSEHADRIDPRFLPLYLPEHNLDELVNADLKL
ncbi:transposase [Streptomyces sp. NA02950]|uniref:transposase n=1 Tax=Streptomyces sp. NA02950 TaxID=2742137 RepID=UPI001591EE4A|nr:transposase [Streptomyces sp. NA02950]QKV90647.1 transposase [Streptomyces sp. NA02950]